MNVFPKINYLFQIAPIPVPGENFTWMARNNKSCLLFLFMWNKKKTLKFYKIQNIETLLFQISNCITEQAVCHG